MKSKFFFAFVMLFCCFLFFIWINLTFFWVFVAFVVSFAYFVVLKNWIQKEIENDLKGVENENNIKD